MLRHQLTDDEWELIQDVFPPPKETDRPRVDRRNQEDCKVMPVRGF